MTFWTFCFLAVVVSAVGKLVKTVLDSDRATRLAKVEAELKLELVDRLKDPELVRRVVEARLPEAGASGEGSEEDATTGGGNPAAAEAAPEAKASPQVLVGLICFLVGVAFVIAGPSVDRELLLPGALCIAVGLAFLTFATSRRQIVRHTGIRVEGDPESHRA